MQNYLNDKSVDMAKFIDEQFRPATGEESVYLEEMVVYEMRVKGLDPLNKDDVKKFWASKGVESNG